MRKIIPLTLIAVFALSVGGCAEKGPKKEVIATIGNYSLYKEDFLSESSLYPPEYLNNVTKEQILNNIIEKKVLLLEAQRQGLDRNPEFMKMVERFWEQSLLRSLLNKKSEEILSSIPQSDKDRNRKASGMIKSWIVDLVRKANIDIDREALEKIGIR